VTRAAHAPPPPPAQLDQDVARDAIARGERQQQVLGVGAALATDARWQSRAFAAAIRDARLLELEGVGHQLPPPRTWDLIVATLIEHTTQPSPVDDGP
jgi:hypothetical protein